MQAPSSTHRPPDRHEFVRAVTPLIVLAAIVIVGAILARANGWSTGALWALAVAATILAGAVFAVPAALRAPSLRTTMPAAGDVPTSLTIGARVTDEHLDLGELSPEVVLVLSGHSRSGKSTIAQALTAQQPGWARASCGEYVRARARELGVPPALPDTHALGQQLVEQMGGKGFLQAVLNHAQIPSGAGSLIIDDVYHVAVFEALRDRWQGLRFTTVDLPESVRRSLLHEQGLDDRQVEELEESPLDHAVEQLERQYTPEIRLTGAASAADADVAIGEIGALLAA
jgi:hypothetical protein